MKNLIFMLLSILLLAGACKKSKVRPEAPQDGLLFYCDFNDNLKDQQGYTSDGVKTGTPTFVSGREGKALNINGSGQKVTFTPITSQTSNIISVSFWLKNNVLTPDQKFLKLPSLHFATSNNSHSVTVSMLATGTSTDWKINTWNHVVMVKEANTLKLYLNGKMTTPYNLPPGTIEGFNGSLVLGSVDSDWLGIVDELYVYHRTLTDQEVKVLYQRGL